MISYIFKNKTKNMLVILFAALSILCSDFIKEIYFSITMGLLPSAHEIINTLPTILIFVYMLTLKREYKFKTFVFPAAFAIWSVYYLYELVFDAIYTISTHGYFIVTDIISYASYIFAIIACVFCFIGSIQNFKKVVFLKLGAIIKISGTIITSTLILIIEYGRLGGKEYFTNIYFEYLDQLYNSMLRTGFKMLVPILFFVGILLLTFNKKSEDIDITPFVEARRTKREAKKQAKLKQKEAEQAEYDAPPPEIPDGFWRCMACGKILDDSINRCECGYKK